MSNDVSLETRASAAYVQGELETVIACHQPHTYAYCGCMRAVAAIVLRWKQAEAELKAQTTVADKSRMFDAAQFDGDRCNDGGCRYGDFR